MMVSDTKKSQTSPAPKDAVSKKEDAPKTRGDAAPSKVDGGEKADATPSAYSRGEGQKLVTQAYRDNWNAIFAKKKKKKR